MHDVLEDGVSLVEAVLVGRVVQGWVNTQVHIGTQTGTQTKTDRDTHSVYVLYDVLEGRVASEGGRVHAGTGKGEHRQTGTQIGTDRQVQRQTSTHRYTQRYVDRQTKTERLTESMFWMMSWKVGWVLKGAKRQRWYRCE